MTPFNRRSRRAGALGAAVLSAAALLAVGSSTASAACRANPTSNAFAQFGDEAAYSLAPGGSFETGAPGWSLDRAAVAAGNESFNVVSGSHSLAIAAGGTAASPWVCISGEYPSFRLFVRQLSGDPTATLYVSLRWVNLLGITVNTPAGSIVGATRWLPTPALKLGRSLPVWLPGTSAGVQLVFQTSGTGSWAIDDVFIDPYSR